MKFDFNGILEKLIERFLQQKPQDENSYAVRVKLLRMEAKLLNIAMFSMLAASAYQLAVAFSKNHGIGFFASLKACGIELCIGIFARMLGRAYGLGQSTWLLWTILISAMVVSIFANMFYEWRVLLADLGVTRMTMMQIRYTLDPLAHVEAFFQSGFMALMVLGLAKAQQIVMVSADLYEKQEIKRLRDEEAREERLAYQRAYNKKRRKNSKPNRKSKRK